MTCEVQICTCLCFAVAELYRVVEERVQLRFTPPQSNTCVAIAFETAVVVVAGVFGVMVMSTAGSAPSEYPVWPGRSRFMICGGTALV